MRRERDIFVVQETIQASSEQDKTQRMTFGKRLFYTISFKTRERFFSFMLQAPTQDRLIVE